jgi:hypothetical protein
MKKQKLKKYLIVFGVLCVFFLGGYFFFTKETNLKAGEEKIVLVVNGVEVTEKDIENYMREISRDRFEENLSYDEIRDYAIEDAIGFVVTGEYFKEKNIEISDEELDDEIREYILAEQGAETKEDFFRILERKGISRGEFLRNTILFLKNRKLTRIIAESIEVEEEDIVEKYDYYKNEFGDDNFPSYDLVKEFIEKELAHKIAFDVIVDELNDKGREAEIVFFD